MSGRRFTRRQEPFLCLNCGAEVEPLASGSCRDHCPECLWSRHVDVFPGDRASDCEGPLQPIGLVGRADRQQIAYRCDACGHRTQNRTAPDDDPETLLWLSTLPVPDR